MTDEAILQQLLSEGNQVGSAWEMFLRRFSNLMLKIIWQFEREYDEAMEKYLYVCRKLADNNFAVLRRFQPHHGANQPQFTTWLAAVTHNLCIDAHRASHGRKQLPRAILRLPEFDREVFRLYYWRGCSLEEIEQRMSKPPTGSSNAVAESLERIRSLITSPSLYRSSESVRVSFDEQNATFGSSEIETDFTEMVGWLERWMSELTDQERMIVKLWFWEDMSGHEIAAAMRIAPEQRVYSLLKKAMTRLRERAHQTYDKRGTPNLSV